MISAGVLESLFYINNARVINGWSTLNKFAIMIFWMCWKKNSTMSEKVEQNPVYSTFFGSMGAAAAMILCALGSAYATAIAGAAVASAGIKNPSAIMKSLLPVVMAGIVAIYGLVAAVLIVNSIEANYEVFTGYIHFGAGVSVGLAGMAAGYAIGIVGRSGVISIILQPKFFVGMVLMLIFAEVLGLYGLILGLILITK